MKFEFGVMYGVCDECGRVIPLERSEIMEGCFTYHAFHCDWNRELIPMNSVEAENYITQQLKAEIADLANELQSMCQETDDVRIVHAIQKMRQLSAV
jgi:hypothetical protein